MLRIKVLKSSLVFIMPVPVWNLETRRVCSTVFILEQLKLLAPVVCFAERVYELFGMSNMHRTIDFFPGLAEINQMYQRVAKSLLS